MNYSFVEYSSCSHAAKIILQNKLYVTDPPPGMISIMKFFVRLPAGHYSIAQCW